MRAAVGAGLLIALPNAMQGSVCGSELRPPLASNDNGLAFGIDADRRRKRITPTVINGETGVSSLTECDVSFLTDRDARHNSAQKQSGKHRFTNANRC